MAVDVLDPQSFVVQRGFAVRRSTSSFSPADLHRVHKPDIIDLLHDKTVYTFMVFSIREMFIHLEDKEPKHDHQL